VTPALMGKASPGAVFLHCLPRHAEEVTDEVSFPSSLALLAVDMSVWHMCVESSQPYRLSGA
jgi:ornithine carbamoyltransferase